MATYEVPYGGTTGNRYRLRVDYSEDSVNVGANTSRVVANLYMYTSNEYGWFDGTNPGCNLNIDGQNATGNGNYTNLPTGHSGVKATLIGTQTKTIAHNADGSKTINISFAHNTNASSGGQSLTPASGSFNFVLTHIPRYAVINTFTQDQITDTAFRTNVATDVTCDQLQYSLDGGAWTTVGGGTFTSTNFTLDGLISNRQYTIKVRVRRQDSGLYTESSTANVSTLNQNNFFRMRIP
jgi:hypothetical protein